MNIKKNIFTSIFCTISLLQSSNNEEIKDQSSALSRRKALTSEELRIHQERQCMIAASDPKTIEICTDDALRVALDQVFLYGHEKYKKVILQDFYHNYPDVMESFIERVQETSALSHFIQSYVFDKYTQIPEAARDLPASREISSYRIIGSQPFKGGFYDALYDATTAKERVVLLAKQFIRENYRDVYKTCNSLKKNKNNSHKVICLSCCNVLLHKKCLIACQSHNVSSCPNAQCQRAENGTYFSKTWNKSFYEQALEAQPLSIKDIPAGTCSLCEEDLKNNNKK